MRETMALTAAAAVSITGPLGLQGRQAARGLELWASLDRIQLHLVDDAGSSSRARETYLRWLDGGPNLLLGPYGSGLVREVAPIVTTQGVLLWNHGGSEDGLARPLLVPVPAPASTYFEGAVRLAHQMGLRDVAFIHGRGRFAYSVIRGGRDVANELGLQVRTVALDDLSHSGFSSGDAVLIVGTFPEDLAAVREIRSGPEPSLLGCVAAGLPEFGDRLGPIADGVVAPVQWVPSPVEPEVGPSGVEFRGRYMERYGEPPDYVAAQATATGYLAAAAHRHGYQPNHITEWRTTTLLGKFALDRSWRQVGHPASTIQWREGRQVPIA